MPNPGAVHDCRRFAQGVREALYLALHNLAAELLEAAHQVGEIVACLDDGSLEDVAAGVAGG